MFSGRLSRNIIIFGNISYQLLKILNEVLILSWKESATDHGLVTCNFTKMFLVIRSNIKVLAWPNPSLN